MQGSALLCGLVLLAAPGAASKSPWAVMAEQDLQAIHRAVLESHPGPVDARNPGFSRWLEQGYRESLTHARAARSFGGYAAALRRYAAGFRDGHLSVSLSLEPAQVQWPGFLVAQRAGRFVVSAVDEKEPTGLPAPGTELLSCDGTPSAQLLERSVWPYVNGPDVEARRVRATPQLLVDVGNPEVPRARACDVRGADGQVHTVTLRYRQARPAELWERSQAAAFGPRPSFGVHPFGEGGLWVSIPSFYAPESEATLKGLRELVAQAPGWREARVVVLDVRGNGGGSSAWGDSIVQGLYGEALVSAVQARDPARDQQYVDWRVSKDNLAHLRFLVDFVAREQGPESPMLKHVQRVTDGMAGALARREALFRLREEDEGAKAGTAAAGALPPLPPSPMRGQVFLLTDGRCASACLDFADAVLAMPGVTHVGQPTSADSVYMEVRIEKLPSGAAELALPVKVYRNRPRGHNVPYVPAHRYPGAPADTAALEAWVLALAAKVASGP